MQSDGSENVAFRVHATPLSSTLDRFFFSERHQRDRGWRGVRAREEGPINDRRAVDGHTDMSSRASCSFWGHLANRHTGM